MWWVPDGLAILVKPFQQGMRMRMLHLEMLPPRFQIDSSNPPQLE